MVVHQESRSLSFVNQQSNNYWTIDGSASMFEVKKTENFTSKSFEL
ncbi:MAG: hypothetical protein F6K23_31500 [Okeania sp. SIO2C9]|nr:hypothetical protein [Okeania sp. SIO2C9]NEQ77139.1 hypothetical protein [Okeania sp. SIO2C9]